MNRVSSPLASLATGAALLFALSGCGGGGPQSPSPTPPATVQDSIVFVSTRDGAPEIYRMNPDGSAQTRLTTGIGNADNPSQSRDGRIVFQSNRDGNSEIYTINRDGSGLLRLTNDSNASTLFDTAPAFSPDGKTIAWISERGGIANVWLMDASGQNQRQFTSVPIRAYSPAWTPDGGRIGYFSDTGNGFRDTNAKLEIKNVASGQVATEESFSSPGHLRFNATGNQVIYQRGTLGLFNLGIYDINSNQEKSGPAAPPANSINRAPDFSPDGRVVVWDAFPRFDSTQPRPDAQIYRANADGTGITTLTTQGANYSPDW